jgi:predicted HTH transcriptional regulator
LNRYINNLISLGENNHLDFKFEISDAKKIARSFSAFANTKGGKLLIGVKDNGAIAGIRSDEEIFMIESAAEIFCKPKVVFTFKSWQVDGKTILEVDIPESSIKPHLAPWKDNLWRAFIREHDQNFVADAIMVQVWKNKREQKATLIKYNRIEKELLDYLKTSPEISLKDFCELSKIKHPIAKRVLINLVTIGVVKINTSENSSTFSLNEDFSY